MKDSPRPIVSGTFRDQDSLDRAVTDFRSRGYTDDDFHVVMSDDTRKKYYADGDAAIDEGSKAMEGAGVGAATGGSLGGIIGAIAGIGGAVIVPGIGAVAGPLAGALAGAGAGGAAGSLLGALVGAGIPEKHAKMYEDDVKNGGMMLGVNPRDDDHEYVKGQYTKYGADNVYASTR